MTSNSSDISFDISTAIMGSRTYVPPSDQEDHFDCMKEIKPLETCSTGTGGSMALYSTPQKDLIVASSWQSCVYYTLNPIAILLDRCSRCNLHRIHVSSTFHLMGGGRDTSSYVHFEQGRESRDVVITQPY